MAILGAQGFLENSIGRIVRGLYSDRVSFETTVGGAGGVNSTGAVLEGADLMAIWLQRMWDSIWKARDECPKYVHPLPFDYNLRSSFR